MAHPAFFVVLLRPDTRTAKARAVRELTSWFEEQSNLEDSQTRDQSCCYPGKRLRGNSRDLDERSPFLRREGQYAIQNYYFPVSWVDGENPTRPATMADD
jgi:hypothetical protein